MLNKQQKTLAIFSHTFKALSDGHTCVFDGSTDDFVGVVIHRHIPDRGVSIGPVKAKIVCEKLRLSSYPSV